MGLKKKEEENKNKVMLDSKSKYRNIITITIILSIILITLLTLNNVGVLNKIGKIKEQMTEAEATAKLEQALETAKTKKETDETYNKEQYINDLLETQNISIYDDIATISGYNYQIDRENLSIIQVLGKTNVEITTKVLNLLGQNDKGKERATIEIEVTSNIPLENIVYQNEDRTYVKEIISELTYKKELELELDKDYVVTVETKDGKLNTKVFKNTKEDYKGPSAGQSGYAGGAYNDPYVPVGFKHIGTEDWNSGYTIIGETSSIGNEFVWVPCVLTTQEKQAAQNNGDTVQIFEKVTTGKYLESIMSLTPDPVEANYIKTSVGTYGGFYIAKYEAGIPGTTQSVTTEHNTSVSGNILPVSKPNVGVWNFINRENAKKLSDKMINYQETGVHSTLISGAAWDTTLQWITNTTDNAYATASTDKGNHSRLISVTSSNFNTAYSKNNIYDMAGNVWEWTTEDCTSSGSSGIVARGRCL